MLQLNKYLPIDGVGEVAAQELIRYMALRRDRY